jgi:hypothetical protein
MESVTAELTRAGFHGSKQRLAFLGAWLHGNDVRVISDLNGLSRSDFDNIHELVEDELVFVEKLLLIECVAQHHQSCQRSVVI